MFYLAVYAFAATVAAILFYLHWRDVVARLRLPETPETRPESAAAVEVKQAVNAEPPAPAPEDATPAEAPKAKRKRRRK